MKRNRFFENLNSGNQSSPKILCIDDEFRVLDALKRQFNRSGFQTLTAHHGMAGLIEAGVEKPDIILTDLQMPRGRGDDLIQVLRTNPATAQIPVIVVTGVRDPSLESSLISIGAKAVLFKPIRFEELLASIRTHLPVSSHRPATSIFLTADRLDNFLSFAFSRADVLHFDCKHRASFASKLETLTILPISLDILGLIVR